MPTVHNSPGETARGEPRPAWLRYGAGVAWAVAALVIRLLIPGRFGLVAPFLTFFPAVILSAWFGGVGPGLLTIGLSAFFAVYFLLPPIYVLRVDNPTDIQNLLRFIAGSVVVTALIEAVRTARQLARKEKAAASESRRLLREQEQLAAVTLSSIADAVIATDLEGKITFMNPVAEALTGWKAADAAGQGIETVFRIYVEETGALAENPIRQAISAETTVSLASHTILETKSGAKIPIDDSGAPIRDAEGRLKGAVLVFRDITRQRKAAEELLKSQQQLATILESISDGFIALDRQWRYTYVNAEAAKQSGIERSDMLGKSIWELFPHRAGTTFQKNLERAMTEQVPVAFEAENTARDKTFRLRAHPSAEGISIYAINITAERKEAATRNELAAIVESSDDAIYSEDLNGIVRTWNKGAEQIFGYTAAEMVGHSIAALAANDRLDDTPQLSEQIRLGERIDHYEAIRRHKDGRLLDISLTVSPTRDSAGNIIGASKIARDITQQKAARQALLDSEARLKIALEAGTMGAWEWDIGRDRLTWSPQLEAIHGLGRGTFGGTLEDFQRDLHPDDKDRVLRAIRDAADQRHDYRIEYRIVRQDGAVQWLEDRGRMLSGDPPRMAGVSLDITDRKETEKELLHQAEQLSRSNADLRDFAYIASHDLQEPLRNIFTFTQLLAQRYRGKFDAEGDTFMKYVADSAMRMKVLIRDLLNYSQLIHSEDMAPADVPLNQAVNSALGDLRTSIEESGAVIEVDPLPRLRVNQSQMVQLFQNLISNAIKYRSSEPPRIHITACEKDGEWVFSVGDNGIGIEPQYHEKIFGVFRRLHGSDYPGTGIGLSICKRIVEKHGGRIWVESQAGKGSSFQFSIATKGEAAWTTQAHPSGS